MRSSSIVTLGANVHIESNLCWLGRQCGRVVPRSGR